MVNPHYVVNELLNTDGVESVYVDISIEPVVRKVNTGEVDHNYQVIRKRVLSEDEIEEIIPNEMSYYGTIDVMGDFHVKDKATFSKKYESGE